MKKYISVLLALLMLATNALPAYAAESATATTMRLEKTEGTVSLTNQNGTKLPIRKNSKLYSGYAMATKAASYAYIGLDDEKAVKLDESSSVTVKKSGKKLELLVGSGQLFFNVKTPLKSDESLEIRTSNMVTGIRGTAGVIKNVSASTTEFYLLDGTVTISYIGTAMGQASEQTVTAGEHVTFTTTVAADGTPTAAVQTKPLTETDISGFVATEIAQDSALQSKIATETTLNVSQIASGAADTLKKEQEEHKKSQSEVDKALDKRTNVSTGGRPDSGPDSSGGSSGGNSDGGGNGGGNSDGGGNDGGNDGGNSQTSVYFIVGEGGSPVPPQHLTRGDLATKPNDPTRLGFLFDGWYADPERKKPFDFNDKITHFTYVYAKWKDDPANVKIEYLERGANSGFQAFSITDSTRITGVTVKVTIENAKKGDGTSVSRATDTFTLNAGQTQFIGGTNGLVLNTSTLSGASGEIYLPLPVSASDPSAIFGTYIIEVTGTNGVPMASKPIDVKPAAIIDTVYYATVEAALLAGIANTGLDSIKTIGDMTLPSSASVGNFDTLIIKSGTSVTLIDSALLTGETNTAKIEFGASLTNISGAANFYANGNPDPLEDAADFQNKIFIWDGTDKWSHTP